MTTVKRKSTVRGESKKYAAKDREDNKKFLTILAIATLAVMVLMYFIFTR